jgi:hypothetical protein
MCHLNSQGNTLFPLIFPVTIQMLLGLLLIVKPSTLLSKDFSHFSRNLLLFWVSTHIRQGSIKKNIWGNFLFYKVRNFKKILLL